MKTYEECCAEIAKKHFLGTKLLTGHKASYFKEAAMLYTNQRIDNILDWLDSERLPSDRYDEELINKIK